MISALQLEVSNKPGAFWPTDVGPLKNFFFCVRMLRSRRGSSGLWEHICSTSPKGLGPSLGPNDLRAEN